MLSQRIRKFQRALLAARDQNEFSLIAYLRDKRTPTLLRLACLRELVCRVVRQGVPGFGLPYPQRKRVMRQMIGA